MGSVRRGASFVLTAFEEDAYNDGAVTPVGHKIPIAGGVNFGSYQGPTVDSTELQDDLEPAQGFEDIFKNDGTFPLATTVDAVGIICYWLFTGFSVTGVGPYVSTFVPDVADPVSLGLDLGDLHTSTPKYDLEYGCYIQGLDVSLSKEGKLLEMSVTVFGSGKHDDDGATPQDASPAAYADTRLQPRKSTVEIDSTHIGRIRECNFSIMRDIQGDQGLNNEDFHNEIIFGGYTYDLSSLVATFDYASTMRAYEDGAEHEVKITIFRTADATRYVEFTFGGVLFPRTDKRTVADRGPQTCKYSGLKPTSLSIDVVGEIADYSAIV